MVSGEVQQGSLLKVVIISVALLAVSVCPAAASVKEELEKNIFKKDWVAVDKIVSSLSLTEKQNETLKEDAVYVSSFLKGYSLCSQLTAAGSEQKEKRDCILNLFKNRENSRPKGGLHFSRALVDDFNKELRMARDEVKFLNRVIASTEEKRSEDQRHDIARIEAVAESTYREARQKAEETVEYKSTESACSICSCLEQNVLSEQAISEEKKYSKKYGVINLSKIDSIKQSIMLCDSTIREQRTTYFKITKKKFDKKQCHAFHNRADEDDIISCENSFIRTGKNIIKSLIASEPENIQAIIIEKHLKSDSFY